MRQTPWQLFRFAFIYLNTQPTAYLLPTLLTVAGYLGWISVLGALILSLLILWCTMAVGKASPQDSWLNFGEQIVGKWPHRLFLVIIILWVIIYVAIDIESYTLFYGTNYMRATPQWVIQLILGPVIIITARWGLVPLIYMADGLFFLTLATLVLVLSTFAGDAHFNWLPGLITHTHYGDAAKGIFITLSFIGEWFVFLVLAPLIQMDRRAFRNLSCAILLLTLSVLLEWVLILLNLGLKLSSEIQYPLIELMRSSITGVLGNADPLIIGLWATSMFIHSAFLLQVGARIMTRLLSIHDSEMEKPFITLLGGTASVAAYQFAQNPALYQENFDSMVAVVFWLLVDCIPVIYWIVLKLRGGISKPGSSSAASDSDSGNNSSQQSPSSGESPSTGASLPAEQA
ncbi:GerAB/ArcD/ProY family transporter [Paenibacillus sp. F411]|uniref:Spore germination protein n=1 Tax=Paenibacillus algicola TaxID=2565926 RepID=A0A4P8XLS6_9BACL|nr:MULTISPECIES: GerAB/ArcD/ProY family transporter [Paenibacillus]MBO2943669.1 GerAB/ArcD/ProY family transporter [Paenibacillus sp. F411]QCT03722.1 Spore germination protein [Paenibacillus algicola]